MSVHQNYIKDLDVEKNVPLCDKPLEWKNQRLSESKKLTQSMDTRSFSFLRLGDMDLTLLLAIQDKYSAEADISEDLVSGTKAQGNPGIGLQHSERLWNAFQKATYVDFHQILWINEQLLPKLSLSRDSHLLCNPTKEVSYIIPTWVETEFRAYCERNRVGFAGAEASLLKILSESAEYRKMAHAYWPSSDSLFFHQVRDNGQNLNENLDLIKEDLRRFITSNQLDTLFLALGGGAKILCYELAEELEICALDFGSMLRMLTYSGSDGNRATRSTHSPFLFRVPFSLYMASIEKAIPDLTPEVILAKAHSQLILDIQKKEVGWTHAAKEYDLSHCNMTIFKRSFRDYKNRYRDIFKMNELTRKERKDFLHFCGLNGLTLEGKLYYYYFILKVKIKTVCKTVFRSYVLFKQSIL